VAKRKYSTKSISTWFAGHVILYFKEARRRQTTFVVWENVYLILARTLREAAKKAEALGRAECIDQGSLKVNGKPARMAFGGVRKVISCAANPMAKDGVLTSQVPLLYSGVEATFSQFLVRGRKNLRSLIAGLVRAPSLLQVQGESCCREYSVGVRLPSDP
jgi:hypothetical protein